MTATAPEVDEHRIYEIAADLRRSVNEPWRLLQHVECWDERDNVKFRFNMTDPAGDWYWQRELLDQIHDEKRVIVLKARQLGATWLGSAYGLWAALYRPGANCLFYRQKEDDAAKLVGRIWLMLHSLPKPLWNGAKVVTPKLAVSPHLGIELLFPDGRISKIIGQSSSKTSGHGDTATYVLLDEYARIDNAKDIMRAVNSAVGDTGRMLIVSTANGVSGETGEGNHFHRLWVEAQERGLGQHFLSWRSHPGRDDDWYENSPEVRQLDPWERAEQYPDNPHEAFAGTGGAEFFPPEHMWWYGQNHIATPEHTGLFEVNQDDHRKATFAEQSNGHVRIFKKPEKTGTYAIGADAATARGLDYSAAYVIDLATRELCAEVHVKAEPDDFAEQLHYLGRWYNTAKIAVELGGGYGDPVIIALRDGRAGRPAYPNIYRHRQQLRGDKREHQTYGFPMNSHTRPGALAFFKECVRERSLPWLTDALLSEMQTFVRYDPAHPEKSSGTWPRARSGCHDDCVMAAAVTLEMYREHGTFEHRERKRQSGKRASAPVERVFA